jgi:octaheme c-type cytochrome (tetrathionate reductase family)
MLFGVALITVIVVVGAFYLERNPGTAPDKVKAPPDISTADHSTFEILQQDFVSGPDVTLACLTCHTQAAAQVQDTIHWTWEFKTKEGEYFGKAHVINGFSFGVASNSPFCNSCHIGYSVDAEEEDYHLEENVDCLICHDQTGEYRRNTLGVRHPEIEENSENVDCITCHERYPSNPNHPMLENLDCQRCHAPVETLQAAAQSVAKPNRQNCGTCHFFGGSAVKHGNLDPTLADPPFEVDVHMSKDGSDFSCVICHAAPRHSVTGSRYEVIARDTEGAELPIPASEEDRATCESCHGLEPMKNPKLNDHVARISCQTCHIPGMAKGDFPTLVSGDWTTAGELIDGEPFVEVDENGWVVFDSMNGSYTWAKDVIPEYIWFDGTVHYLVAGDVIDPTSVVEINAPGGFPDDPYSRVWPFKVYRSKQVYDSEYNTIVVPHLVGDDEAAFWNSWDWDVAIEAGMQEVGGRYSGNYAFVETVTYWPLTHMVAPIEDSLSCADCHEEGGGVIAEVRGIYLPGRDGAAILDWLGIAMVALPVVGVATHTVGRLLVRDREDKNDQKSEKEEGAE